MFSKFLDAAIVAGVFMIFSPAFCLADTQRWLTDNAMGTTSSHKMENSKLTWYDGAKLTIEGRPFVDSVTSYSRLAVRHKADVTTDVWRNALSAAGVTLRFVTDSPTISASWENAKQPMGHMAWSGSGGLDLYSRDGDKWMFRGVGIPTTTETENVAVIQKFRQEPVATEYLLFLPLYSQVDKIEIGIEDGAKISTAPPRYEGQLPIVFYGTSITMGGCASRAGMSHPAIIRRMLDYPVINLGFSGSGKSEMGVARVLAEIPASVYVLEPVQNMTVEMIEERIVPFVKHLRSKRADTPILMVESPNVWSQGDKHVVWKKAFDQLKAEGISGLHYMKGDGMYRSQEDGTVDRTHPTDLGFYDMAVAYDPVLRQILNDSGVKLDAGK